MADFFRQGAHGSDAVTGLLSLHGHATTGVISTLRLSGATAGYPVTAAKTFYITRVLVGGNTGASISIGYGDTDVGENSAADPTNYKPLIGSGHIGVAGADITPLKGTIGVSLNCIVSVPAGKYMTVYSSGNVGAVLVEGYEV